MRILRRFRERERSCDAALRLAMRRKNVTIDDDDVIWAAVAELEPRAQGEGIIKLLEWFLEHWDEIWAIIQMLLAKSAPEE